MYGYINNVKNNKGFSLVEVIIAIAVLALLSGYVLQSFIVSEELNKKAAALDTATYKCVSIIETFKANPELTLKEDYQNLSSNSWQTTFYYGEDWQPCTETDYWAYIIYSNIEKDTSNLYTINVSANKMVNDVEINITTFNAKKYIPERVVY